MMDNSEIELAIDDWSTFIQSHNIHKNSPSVSIDGLQWNFRVSTDESDPNGQNPDINLHLEMGLTQPDPSSFCVCQVVFFLSAHPCTIMIDDNYTTKQEVMVYGQFSYSWGLGILQEHVVDDTVVLKVHISQIDKYCLKQPSSYTLRGQAGRTKVDGVLENIQCPTLLVSYIDDQLENPIELWTFNPFMACSFKRVEFIPPPEIENPEGVENFENYWPKQDSKLRPDCKELVILRSFYPIDDGGLAWINFIQIRPDLESDSITNRWLKLTQPPRPHHDGLAFTALGWVMWKCDKIARYNFRFRMWIFGENEVECIDDKVIIMGLGACLPIVLFTFDKIYSLGVGDIAICALKGDHCFKWIMYSTRPNLSRRSRAKLLQWREDSVMLVDGHEEMFIYEIKSVCSKGEKWYNVIVTITCQ